MRPVRSILLGCMLALCLGMSLEREGTAQEPWQSSEWLRLLHYKKRWPGGGLRSEIDEGTFFFSPEGARSPEAEYQASRQALISNRPLTTRQGLTLPSRCAFPARWEFIRRSLNSSEEDCPELQRFLSGLEARTITLVFSSSYPNSPPSMFGHTLLRLGRGKGNPLLDYGLNYSARADENAGPAEFALLGILGGYPGAFSLDPYYLKVNEYNHSESRDLWEYDLSLSESEIALLLKHVWELHQNAVFHYYFADENCSYRLLTLLEVARRDWTLSKFAIHAIPGETIKRVVAIPGAVRAIHYRPSLRKKMLAQVRALSPLSREHYERLMAPGDPGDPQAWIDVAALDAAIATYRVQASRSAGKLEAQTSATYSRLLMARSRLKGADGPDVTEKNLEEKLRAEAEDSRPELGHGPYQLSLAGGVNQLTGSSRGFGEVGFKLAYHDLLNDDRGYQRLSHVDFPWLKLRASGSRVWVEEVGLLAATSLFPLTRLERQLSWQFEALYRVPKDLACESCHVFSMTGGGGMTLELGSERAALYALGLARIEAGSTLGTFFRYGPALRLGALVEPVQRLKLALSGSLYTDLNQSLRQKTHAEPLAEASWNLAHNWELRARGLGIVPLEHGRGPMRWEHRLGLYRYF